MTLQAQEFPDFSSQGTLRASDFDLEINSQLDTQRAFNMIGRSAGIVSGLDVTIGQDLRSLVIDAGLALDDLGRPLGLVSAQTVSTVDVNQLTGLAVLWLDEIHGSWRKSQASSGDTRILSRTKVRAFAVDDRLPDDAIILGEFSLGSDSLLRGVSYESRNLSVMKFFGIELPRPDVAETGFNPLLPLAITPTDDGSSGVLRFTSPRVDFFGSLEIAGRISIGDGGDASGAVEAALSVTPPGAIAGTARIGNEGVNVFTAQGGNFGSVSPGDQLIFQPDPKDLSSGAYVTTVAQVQSATTLTVEDAPGFDTSEINFSYRMSKLLRVVDGYGRNGLVATSSGSIWLGDMPMDTGEGPAVYAATLNILGGDVILGGGQALKFEKTGWIRTADYSVAVGTYPGDGPVILAAEGGLSVFTDQSGTNAIPSLVATAGQNIGIGVADPDFKLSVNGMIKARGLVFPDGSIQTDSVIPIPIGTIIDWWSPPGSDGFAEEGFQICDGSQITDRESPLFRQATPDLSNLLVRGVTALKEISVTGGNATHKHTYEEAVHTHSIVHSHNATGSTAGSTSGAGDNILGSSIAPKDHTHDIDLETASDSGLTSQQNTQPAQQTTDPGSNLPPHMFALKVMRIK